MEISALCFYQCIREMMSLVLRMKKYSMMLPGAENIRIREIDITIKRLDDVLKKFEGVAQQLVEEEKNKNQLSEEYDYYLLFMRELEDEDFCLL